MARHEQDSSRPPDRLVALLVRALADAQDGPWDLITFRATVAGDRRQSSVSLVGPGFPPPAPREPAERDVWEVLADLRAAMADPGTGAWFTLTIDVPVQGDPVVVVDAEREPSLLPPATPADYALDLARHPRDVGAQPPWLRERLSWAALTPDQARRADIGRDALDPWPTWGGSRPLFPVALQGKDVVVTDGGGRRAVVAPDDTVEVVDTPPTSRER
ncbi:hypothetical protein IF650_01120 [Cellulosimicrobium terreum]|nr:hypothetical protein [Cellulosimicrobium terreum]